MMRMRKKSVLLILILFGYSYCSFAQQPDTLIKKLDSLSVKADTLGKQKNNINPQAYTGRTNFTFSSYFILLGSDLKQEVTSAFHWGKKGWATFGSFVLAEGGLAFLDKPIQRNAFSFRNNHASISKVSGYVTNFGGAYEVYTLAAFGAYGLIFKSDKVKTTTLLATQAYITGGAMESVLKFLSGRQRPEYYSLSSPVPSPRFHDPFSTGKDINGKTLNSSFPSGHTTVAFAAATVFAVEYKNVPAIPIIAYTSATLIGLSRITENKHWATDVLAGAVLGYFTGRQVVNNYHRYATLKSPKSKRTISFNLQYNFGQVMPGIVYSF